MDFYKEPLTDTNDSLDMEMIEEGHREEPITENSDVSDQTLKNFVLENIDNDQIKRMITIIMRKATFEEKIRFLKIMLKIIMDKADDSNIDNSPSEIIEDEDSFESTLIDFTKRIKEKLNAERKVKFNVKLNNVCNQFHEEQIIDEEIQNENQDIQFIEEQIQQLQEEKQYHKRRIQELNGESDDNEEENILNIDYNYDNYTRSKFQELNEKLESNPTNFQIDFTYLRQEPKLQFYKILLNHIKKTFNTIPIMEKYEICYKIDNDWHQKPLLPENYAELIQNLEDGTNIVQIFDEYMPEYKSDEDNENLPPFTCFRGVGIHPLNRLPNTNNQVIGSFFPFLVQNVPGIMINYLRKLQIFDTLIIDGKQRKEFNDCCFIYALKQAGVPETELNQIRCKILLRTQSVSKIDKICIEHYFHIILHCINDDQIINQNKKYVFRRKNGSKNYLGVKKDLAKKIIHLNIYKGHFFIEEKTIFSSYYINNFHNLNPKYYNKRFTDNHWKVCDKSHCISSNKLVRKLMENGYFIPITYGQFNIIKTDF